MATDQKTAEYILEQASLHNQVRIRKMFGEYALYCNEKVVALICDNQLFVKMTDTGLGFINDPIGVPPYPGAKNYLQVPEEKLEEREWMSELIRETANVLPEPKPKKYTVK